MCHWHCSHKDTNTGGTRAGGLVQYATLTVLMTINTGGTRAGGLVQCAAARHGCVAMGADIADISSETTAGPIVGAPAVRRRGPASLIGGAMSDRRVVAISRVAGSQPMAAGALHGGGTPPGRPLTDRPTRAIHGDGTPPVMPHILWLWCTSHGPGGYTGRYASHCPGGYPSGPVSVLHHYPRGAGGG